MSLQLILKGIGDFSEVEEQQSAAEARNQKINNALEETEKRTKVAFDEAIAAMRASYMMVSGITQIIGGSMGQMFSSLYAVAISSIQVFSAIAAAQFFVPGMQMQSVLMMSSLMSAIASLGAVMTGQDKLAKSVSGINMTLQGFSQLIGVMSY